MSHSNKSNQRQAIHTQNTPTSKSQAKVNEINSDEIAQLVKVIAAESNNLNSVLGTPVVEGENRFPKVVL